MDKNKFTMKTEPAGADFEMLPVDDHEAICIGIIDLGEQFSSYEGKESWKKQLWFQWYSQFPKMN